MTRPSPTGRDVRFFTISRKIASGYVLVTLFSVVAIAYALSSLYDHTERSERLVEVEFRSLNLLRDMREHLLAQETLEKQYLILKEPPLLELLNRRQHQFDHSWRELWSLRDATVTEELAPLVARYDTGGEECRELLQAERWTAAEQCSRGTLSPRRNAIIRRLGTLTLVQEQIIDDSLLALTSASNRAYRDTWVLALLGILLSAPVAATVLFSIHRSLKALVNATREISAGRFTPRVDLDRRDEFGLLAREFVEMGAKLREMEQACLDANPLTRLPGNLAIDREIEARVDRGEPFAHLYIDLDNFKAFGDRYGYQAGSEAIAWVGEVVRKAVREAGGGGDLVGHIGGDDYVVLTAPGRAEEVARRVIEDFDRGVVRFYRDEDLEAGGFVGKDRYGVERKIPLLTVSIAIVCSEALESVSLAAIGQECARMKEQLKTLPGSNYLIDRRKT